jgi:hypothetical protein
VQRHQREPDHDLENTHTTADLRALGVELSASKLKKTTLAELKAMLDAKRAEERKIHEATLAPAQSRRS